MSDPKSMPWSDEHLLGYPAMDDTHKEFVALLDAVLGSEDGEFCERLEAFERHAVAHFAEEDAWMKRTDFPPKDCHIEEHAKVLTSVREVLELVRQGNVAEGRRLAAALKDWFPGHAFHLDSALAHWMVKRSYGGKPVVLRRNLNLDKRGS